MLPAPILMRQIPFLKTLPLTGAVAQLCLLCIWEVGLISPLYLAALFLGAQHLDGILELALVGPMSE